ncbi:MAG: hypothetical protein C0432_00650 [Candidatus Puniceispirillum sp.]|nr:hypothetical protein [Candidatus Pelagibacter sp.]MBA4282792.1 hypothetical protein [Candidatus Puniceispirillum sp.]
MDLSLRQKLALTYKIASIKSWDNWTYTHMSCRNEDNTGFYINPFNCLFKDVQSSELVEVIFSQPLEQYFELANPTGVLLHNAIYQSRSDVNSIVHLHTTAGVAVSSMKCGLLPISQFALHFYNTVSYHAYDSLVLDEKTQCYNVAKDLENNNVMFLENHGTISVGSSVEEAFFLTHHLEEACKVQCLCMSCHTPLIYPSHEICQKAHADLMNFETHRGERDWNAALSLISKADFDIVTK